MSQNGAFRLINGQLYRLKPRDYVVNIPHDANPGSTAQGFIQVDPAENFLLFNRFINDTQDPTTAAPGLSGQYENSIMVQDQSDNYSWSNDFVWRSAFARDRTHGYDLDAEVMIMANTRFMVTIRNPAAGQVAGTSTITLQGYSLVRA